MSSPSAVLTRLPVFVGGFRSGSTLLINLLGLHADIAPWFETKCLVEALRWIKILGDPQAMETERALATPSDLPGFTLDAVAKRMLSHGRYTNDRIHGKTSSGKAAHESYPLGADCVAYSFEEFRRLLDEWRRGIERAGGDSVSVVAHTGTLIRALGDLHLQRLGGRIWVNKTPEMPRFGRELRFCLGDCKIVHLIRDGREVALSGAGLNWGTAGRMARYWAGLIEESREAARDHQADYLEIRFERLVTDPRGELGKVFAFLGAPDDTTLVPRYEKLSGKAVCAAERGVKTNGRLEDEGMMEEIVAEAREMLVRLGYLR